MIFVKTENLKQGMRLAKPVYNKKGVLLYGRNTKLTDQGIASVKNFELIGVYILEPAEPLPPMSDEDIEFERFQTMAVFSLKEDIKFIMEGKQPQNLDKLADLILINYGRGNEKVNFTQSLRSPSDYVYKHSLNTAMLATFIGRALREPMSELKNIVIAALLHDIGLLTLNAKLACKDEPDDEEMNDIRSAVKRGYSILDNVEIPTSSKRIISQVQREVYSLGSNVYEGKDKTYSNGTKILMVADKYDKCTAMKLDEEPTSEVVVIKQLLNNDSYDDKVTKALISSIKILTPGVCVELVSGEKGLVIKENEDNVLKPIILGFNSNRVYNLENAGDSYQIKDIMKTMDNRIITDRNHLKNYLK